MVACYWHYHRTSEGGKCETELSGYIQIKNLKEVLEKLEGLEDKAERAAQIGIAQAGLAVQREAQKNASSATRSYEKRVSRNGNAWLKVTPPRHIGGNGSGPNVITGALRRSIRTDIRKGFGNYVAVARIGPSVEYGRAVELGLPKWGGVKYPYLEPAARTLIANGTLNRIFVGAVKREISRG